MATFHTHARNGSTPERGPIPQGKGREGIRKGMEGVATSSVDGSVVTPKSKLKSPMRDFWTWGQR